MLRAVYHDADDAANVDTPPVPLEVHAVDEVPYTPAHAIYFVFSESGKLVYASEAQHEESEWVYAHTGVMHALLALFAGEMHGDTMDRITMYDAQRRAVQVSFLARPPLYVACASTEDSPLFVVRPQLARIHAAIISLVSAPRLERLFSKMPNFDLRGLLSPTQLYLDGVVEDMHASAAVALHALPMQPMDAAMRQRAILACLPSARDGLLYLFVVRDAQIAALAHPKHHTPHPEDVALLLAMARCGPARTQPPEHEAWAPICLPHAAPHGFVYVYTSVVEDATLFMVTSHREGFHAAQAWRAGIDTDALLDALHAPCPSPPSIPRVYHYAVVGHRYAQCTGPAIPSDATRLVSLYTHLLARLQGPDTTQQPALDAAQVYAPGPRHAALALPLKLLYYRTATEAILGWRTGALTLCLAVRPPYLRVHAAQ
ncbi:Mon1p [Malassezia vespertilionis]|uniref:Vacuolar fusion protein MON1 n=1 Tax=Malassezia vespertilionis TaxID=2020962 RepID=A0A2N1JFM7_9BASI|nr:Mon1p [Malassezia vespertilionis]